MAPEGFLVVPFLRNHPTDVQVNAARQATSLDMYTAWTNPHLNLLVVVSCLIACPVRLPCDPLVQAQEGPQPFLAPL